MNEYHLYYAEDDLDDLHIFVEAFEPRPEVRITHFPDGRALLDRLDSLPAPELPCSIVLDLNMPVLDGRETLIALRREPRYATIPTLLFTTSNSEIDKTFAAHWGVELVTKPIIFSDMELVADRLVALCRTTRS